MTKKNERVEKELEKLVSVLAGVVPLIKEIRVFGSYNNGNWNPETSDIDVFVETSDENYSRYKDRREGNFQGETLESIQRTELKERIKKRVEYNPYEGRFSIHLLSKKDIERLSAHYTGNFIFAAKDGRLLYSNQEAAT